MSKQICFHHGALCDNYEKQANDQGYTLGDDAKLFQKLGFGLIMNHIHGTLTDSAYDKALRKLQKMMVKDLKPLDSVKEEAIEAWNRRDERHERPD